MAIPLHERSRSTESTLIHEVRSRFCQMFGTDREPQVALAPGRVNLIGGHTDYNQGFVLPMAIDRYVAVAVAPNVTNQLRTHSLDFDATYEVRLTELHRPHQPHWFDYIIAIAWALSEHGYEVSGTDIVVAGNVPIGAGLSSSAALELAVARALTATANIEWDPVAIAKLAQRAENEWIGVRCGIMDQLAAAASIEGCALLIDCRTLDTTPVPIPEQAAVVILDTGSRRSLATEAYNDRRRSCEVAVQALRKVKPDIRALRDVDCHALARSEKLMDAVTFKRARHVVAEIARPLEMADALRAGDLERAGRLMNDSHQSLRDLYEVSSDELDLITDLALEHPACFGARLTGAGFGGCAAALVDAALSENFAADVGESFRLRTNLTSVLYICRPVGGARIV